MSGGSPSPAPSGGGAGVARTLGPLLGLAFLALGGAKLNAPAGFVETFAAWGLHPGLVWWTGAMEVLLGLGVFFHGTRTVAAGVLAGWMAGAAGVHLWAGDPALAALPAAVAVAAAGVAVSGSRAGWHRALPLPAPLRHPPRGGMPAAAFLLRLVGVSFLIRWAVGGTLFWAALPLLGLMHARADGARTTRERVGIVLLYLLVLGMGVAGVYGFVGHYFLSDQVARSIGWDAGSPFQLELAFYHLGMGTAALLCLWIRDRYWIAAGLTPSLFALGAGIVHVQDFVAHGNAAPANWGPGVLIGNFLIPAGVLWVLAWYSRLGGWRADCEVPVRHEPVPDRVAPAPGTGV